MTEFQLVVDVRYEGLSENSTQFFPDKISDGKYPIGIGIGINTGPKWFLKCRYTKFGIGWLLLLGCTIDPRPRIRVQPIKNANLT